MLRLSALSVLMLGCASTVQSTADSRDASVREVSVIPDVLIPQDIPVATDIPAVSDIPESPDTPDGACSFAPPEGAPAGGTVVPIGATAPLSPRVGGFGRAWIFRGSFGGDRHPWRVALLHRNNDIELTRYGRATIDTESTTVPASTLGVTLPYDDLRVDAFSNAEGDELLVRATARASGRSPFAMLRRLKIQFPALIDVIPAGDPVVEGRGAFLFEGTWVPTGRDGSPASRPVSYASLAIEGIGPRRHIVTELNHPGRIQTPRVLWELGMLWASAVIDAGAPRSVWFWRLDNTTSDSTARIAVEGDVTCVTSSYDVAVSERTIAWVEDCTDGAVRVSTYTTDGTRIRLRERIGTTMPNRSPSRIAWNGTHFAVVYRAPREDGPTLQLIDPTTGLAAGGPVHIGFPPGALIPDYLQLNIAGTQGMWGVTFAGLPATNLVPVSDTYLARMGACGTNAP